MSFKYYLLYGVIAISCIIVGATLPKEKKLNESNNTYEDNNNSILSIILISIGTLLLCIPGVLLIYHASKL